MGEGAATATRAGTGAPPADELTDDLADRVRTLDRWIDPELRAVVEDRFWAPIERLTGLEAMVADPTFPGDPGAHVALYADHGPNHARDVAARAASLGQWAFGPLVAARPDDRAELVTGVAVLLALVHDIGMCTDPPVGRRLHAQYAAQLVFSDTFAAVMDALIATDAGRLRSGIERASVRAGVALDVDRTAREVLACAVAHSKSTVPAPWLDDRPHLRSVLRYVVATELASQAVPVDAALDAALDDPGQATFAWITDDAFADLALDVIDAIRLVRAADALRQRGTTLRTSAGFEVVVDARTGAAATVVRSASRRSAFLLEVTKPIVVGEANIRGAELSPGALRFDFHRGALATPDGAASVAAAVAGVIDDIQRDILPSFPGVPIDLELVEPTDAPRFAAAVRDRFVALRPELTPTVHLVAGVEHPTVPPRFDWRGRGRPLADERRQLVLDRIEAHGTRIEHDAATLFESALVVDVDAGEVVIEPGEDASFVVVAFDTGLVVTPLGGYRPAAIEPWVPVGTVGVLRGHDRNSRVSSTRALEVLVIPDHSFLAHWAVPYDAHELVARVRDRGLR